jgi:hypothetical protein
MERVPEALFGLLMVLTFTGPLSIAGYRPRFTGLPVIALGCALAGMTMARGG